MTSPRFDLMMSPDEQEGARAKCMVLSETGVGRWSLPGTNQAEYKTGKLGHGIQDADVKTNPPLCIKSCSRLRAGEIMYWSVVQSSAGWVYQAGPPLGVRGLRLIYVSTRLQCSEAGMKMENKKKMMMRPAEEGQAGGERDVKEKLMNAPKENEKGNRLVISRVRSVREI